MARRVAHYRDLCSICRLPESALINKQRRTDEETKDNNRLWVSTRDMRDFLEQYHGRAITVSAIQNHFMRRHHRAE